MADEEGRPPGAMKSPLARAANAVMGVLVAPLAVLAFGQAPSCMGFGPQALDVVNACPAAVAVLGTPITQPWVGLSCGNAETEDDDGSASWSMPVVGPNGRGTLEIVAAERRGRWQFGALTLTTGGRTIDVLGCAAGGTGAPLVVERRTIAGRVTTVVGEPGVGVGTTCSVALEPSEGLQSCRVGVVCGGRTLYGGDTRGYGQCAADAHGALTMRDGNPSSIDGDPMLELRLGAREVVITDAPPSGVWVVTIATSP